MKKKNEKKNMSFCYYFLGIKYVHANGQCLSIVYMSYQNVPEKMLMELKLDPHEEAEGKQC